MSQTSEDLIGSFFVKCSDVGLDCECTIFGESEDKVKDTMITHMYEYHAIIPEEMTTCMKLKIRENIHSYRDSVRAQILHEIPDIPEKLQPIV
jgi:predicted small metal-binding protein